MKFWQNLQNIIRREIKIIIQRPIYIVASVVVLAFNAIFYLTFFAEGMPQDLPVGVIDNDNTSTSRQFRQQLDATQMVKAIAYGSVREAREAVQTGHIASYLVIPDHFNDDIQGFRRPKITFYCNTLYFLGGVLSYRQIMYMVNLANGAVQREVLRLKGVTERDIMTRIQPIVVDAHQIGNVTTNYGVYLITTILPGVLEMCVILVLIYALGSELKYKTSRQLLKLADDNMEVALLGKLIPYTILFTVLGILMVLLMYQWMHFPIAGTIWEMALGMLAMVMACEAIAIFIIGCVPTLRLAICIGALFSILGFTMAGFTLPIESLPTPVQGLAATFPLRHYFMYCTQVVIFGSGFAGWWKYLVHMLIFLMLPIFVFKRLYGAYEYQNFPID